VAKSVTTVTVPGPSSERQARELAPLARQDPKAAAEVWAVLPTGNRGRGDAAGDRARGERAAEAIDGRGAVEAAKKAAAEIAHERAAVDLSTAHESPTGDLSCGPVGGHRQAEYGIPKEDVSVRIVWQGRTARDNHGALSTVEESPSPDLSSSMKTGRRAGFPPR